jgi:predicted transcriptional regulator
MGISEGGSMKLSPSQLTLLKTIHFKSKTAYIRDLKLNTQIINNNLSTLEKHGFIIIGGSYSLKWAEITDRGKEYLQNT